MACLPWSHSRELMYEPWKYFKPGPGRGRAWSVLSGDVLVSHTVPRAVPSALKGLTSGFGMGPGVSLTQ